MSRRFECSMSDFKHNSITICAQVELKFEESISRHFEHSVNIILSII